MNDTVIEVEGIEKSFGSTRALKGVSLKVDRATVLGLLGPNGAGKTTLVRILTTLLKPDAGHARIDGYDVVRQADQLRFIIGLAGQYAAVDETLTGRENLELVGQLYHLGRAERRRRAEDVLERFALTEAGDRPVRTYSGGMRRRLDLGASLVGRPSVLVLDEPTTGLDPRTRIDLWTHIEELVEEGVTVLLTTQYLEEADRLADRIAVLDGGQVIAEGTGDELKDRMGAAVLEVQLKDGTVLEQAASLLADLGDEAPYTDPSRSVVTLPAKHGAELVISAASRLKQASIEIEEIGLRRPSLDDVFLSLTGHTASMEEAAEQRASGAAS